MTTTPIHHACGHIQHYDINSTIEGKEKRIAWLKGKSCDECRREFQRQAAKRILSSEGKLK